MQLPPNLNRSDFVKSSRISHERHVRVDVCLCPRICLTTIEAVVCRVAGLLPAWDEIDRNARVLNTDRHMLRPWRQALIG